MWSDGSWRLDIKPCMPLDIALYVRDALRLDVDGLAGAPGPIPADVPDRSGILDPGQAARASAAWPRWWTSLLAQITSLDYWDGLRLRPDEEVLAGAYSSMDDEEVDSWIWELRSQSSSDEIEMEAWAPRVDLMNSVARQIAADRRIPIEQISGTVLELVGGGTWWEKTGPNLVVCSFHAMRDAATCEQILNAAFSA